MRIIRGTNSKQAVFKRNIALSGGLGVAGLILFFLPLTGIIQSEFGFWLLVLPGLGLLILAGWFGWQVFKYQERSRSLDQIFTNLGYKLDDSYIFFRSLNLPENRSVGTIDGVLLGSHGALVIEVANIDGEYICEGDTWYRFIGNKNPKALDNPEQYRRRLKDSPTWQVIHAAREVKAWLSVRNLPQVPVLPVVVLTKGVLLSSKHPSCQIIELDKFDEFMQTSLMSHTPVPGPQIISEVALEQIAERLKS